MDAPPDFDEARRIVGAGQLMAEASGHLTDEVAVTLEFHELVAYKTLLKRFFSAAPWSADDAARLSDIVAPHLDPGSWWEHELAGGVRMRHGLAEGGYVLWVTGAAEDAVPSLFDRVFSGPVIPEATPHPRKVKFTIGGTAAPGIWYRRGDDVDDERVVALFGEQDLTDVMVAGDFVTIGLARTSSWEARLDPLLALITELFWDPELASVAAPERTRDELVAEGKQLHKASTEELHLLDPDDDAHREVLTDALRSPEAKVRRVAVATLAQAESESVAHEAAIYAYDDESRVVRRTAIDAAADREDEALRSLFERALEDHDSWTRWKAVRALTGIGLRESRGRVEALAEDPDFLVRMEVAAALREHGQS